MANKRIRLGNQLVVEEEMHKFYGQEYVISDEERRRKAGRTILRFSRSLDELAYSPELDHVLMHFGLTAERVEPDLDAYPEGTEIRTPNDVEVHGIELLSAERRQVLGEVLIDMATRFEPDFRNEFLFIDHTEKPNGEIIARAIVE